MAFSPSFHPLLAAAPAFGCSGGHYSSRLSTARKSRFRQGRQAFGREKAKVHIRVSVHRATFYPAWF
jgi:hypothetical protein